MKLSVWIAEDGRPELLVGGKAWIRGIGLHLPVGGTWYRDGEGELVGGPWEESGGEDRLGAYRNWRRAYTLGGDPLLSLTLRAYGEVVWLRAELHRDLSGLSRADSFNEATFLAPAFSFSKELMFFLATFGLGASSEGYPGGYWPTAQVGKGPRELPKEAFAPLVLFSCEGALAIAPANYFLTSPLVRVPGGAARGLHGAVDYLPAGTRLDTAFACGEDLPGALMRLGDLLLAQGGKTRPQPGDHPLLSTLGYWNAYGGYYTELLRPMDAGALEELAAYFRREAIPVRYFGLDLWYPYREIGQAIRYVPDQKKYPEGLARLVERTGLPYVLHLSALAKENAYGADGANPGVYREIARELKEQRGIAAWHDWLRTQQHLTPQLRSDPEAAERWFSGMAEAFAEQGLPVLLCMQTMGMNLAATVHANIISARSHTDFLFTQREALEQAKALGHEKLLEAWIPPIQLHRQNLLMGMVLYALGMMPFHDLFLSRPHPGLGGERPWEDAVLRALSCGPVGIGDGPGMSDGELVASLHLGGRLLQPDHPPQPHLPSLKGDLQLYFTERRGDGSSWHYLLVLNTSHEERPFQLSLPFDPGRHRLWDGYTGRPVERLAGLLSPEGVAYFVVAPEVDGVSPLGYRGKLIPAPSGALPAERNGNAIRLWSDGTPILVQAKTLSAHGKGGDPVAVERKDGLWIVAPQRGAGWIEIAGR